MNHDTICNVMPLVFVHVFPQLHFFFTMSYVFYFRVGATIIISLKNTRHIWFGTWAHSCQAAQPSPANEG